MKKIIAFTSALVLLGSITAHAQTTATELTPEHFAQLDANKNGGISLEEYEAFMKASFQKLDTNGNASLSRDEASMVLTPEQFAMVDKNNDGKLTLDEFLLQVLGDFHRQDLNQDGEIQK